MAILWRKEMSVGNNIIDYDHRYLILFINTIELCLLSPEERELLLEALEQLSDFAVEHFRREESIQRKIEYPNSLKHRNIHASLLKELKDVENKVKNAETAKDIEKQAPELVKFLRSWLINHVFNHDMLLKPYLEKHPKGFY